MPQRASSLRFLIHMHIYHDFFSECSGPLGIEGGIISNQQITASSTHRALFGLQKWYPYYARLNKKGLINAWTAAENDRWPWIQVREGWDRTVLQMIRIIYGSRLGRFWCDSFSCSKCNSIYDETVQNLKMWERYARSEYVKTILKWEHS